MSLESREWEIIEGINCRLLHRSSEKSGKVFASLLSRLEIYYRAGSCVMSAENFAPREEIDRFELKTEQV